MKDDGGAVGLTECPATLKKSMFSGPEMARVIIEYERYVGRALCRGPGVQKVFLEYVMSLKCAIGEYANQFLKPVATWPFSTHGTLYINMLSTMCIESSPLDVNSTTIYMGTAIREYELSIFLKS